MTIGVNVTVDDNGITVNTKNHSGETANDETLLALVIFMGVLISLIVVGSISGILYRQYRKRKNM